MRLRYYLFLLISAYSSYISAQTESHQEKLISDTLSIVESNNPFKFTDTLWKTSLVAAHDGARDKRTNFHENLWTPAGGCKSCFMNIQHRLYGSVLSPDSVEHCKIAKELSTMVNAMYCKTDVSQQLLTPPKYKNKPLTYQSYLKVDDRKKITTGIIDFITDTIKSFTDSTGYYVMGIGVASRYHLTHLFLDYTNPNQPKWWLFDDFGIGGVMHPKLNYTELQKKSMTPHEVENYYRKYLRIAISGYKKSKTLKNATTAYGEDWPPYERPLYAEIYFITPK